MYCLISAAGAAVQKAFKRHHIFIFDGRAIVISKWSQSQTQDFPFRFQHSSTSSLRRLSLSRIPAADDGILNPTEFLANPSRIPRGTVTDEVARWIWPICWHQLFGFSIVVAFLKYVTISTTTCLTGSHTQTRRGAIFKPFL